MWRKAKRDERNGGDEDEEGERAKARESGRRRMHQKNRGGYMSLLMLRLSAVAVRLKVEDVIDRWPKEEG